MKVIGLVDRRNSHSNNHLLLEFIEEEYKDLFDLELIEITAESLTSEETKDLNQRISAVTGIIVASSEENQTIISTLEKSLKSKAILVINESDYNPESSANYLQFRQMLENPVVGAYTFPGTEFFLGEITEVLKQEGQIKNQEVINSLRKSFKKYIRFIELISGFQETPIEIVEEEDLYATGSIETTIDGLDKDADDWLEQAAKKVSAVDGNTYIKLDRGILTVDQLDYFLNSMPMELTFMDANNQFLYYNYHLPAEKMLASTRPNQLGSPIAKLHPEGGHERVKMLIQQLRSGKTDTFQIHVPTHGPDKFVVHNYRAVRDNTGNYLGVNEYVLDLKPIVDWYLKQNNQKLSGGLTDAISSATKNNGNVDEVDAVSSASKQH